MEGRTWFVKRFVLENQIKKAAFGGGKQKSNHCLATQSLS